MRSHSIHAAGLLVIASLGGCSGHGSQSASSGSCAGCDDGGGAVDAAAAATPGAVGEGGRTSLDTNVDNVPYPSPAGGYGTTARVGATPGSVMKNFKFLGYPLGVPTKDLQTIALADYYDPCNKRYKLLHLSVAGVWCGPCNQETDATVAASPQLAAQRVVVLQAIDDGKVQNQPATRGDLDYWIGLHSSNFTSVLDPGLRNLGGFFDAAAIPWNCDIDPRTMEIVDAKVGWSGNILGDVAKALQSLPTMPSYPLPVQCN